MKQKRKEVMKCPHQLEMGFRLVGLKVYDVRCDKHGWLSKHFGRRIEPSMAFAALALCFSDGVRIRRDVVTVAILKLERIYLWFKSQNSVHFYCSSILVAYDGYLERITPASTCGDDGQHFLKTLPRHFPPTHEKMAVGNCEQDCGVAKNDVNDFVEDFETGTTKTLSYDEEEYNGMTELYDRVHVKMIDFAHALENPGCRA